jgi:hypothetical protein
MSRRRVIRQVRSAPGTFDFATLLGRHGSRGGLIGAPANKKIKKRRSHPVSYLGRVRCRKAVDIGGP